MDDAEMFATQPRETLTQHDLGSSSPLSSGAQNATPSTTPNADNATTGQSTQRVTDEADITADLTIDQDTAGDNASEADSDGFFETQRVATPHNVHTQLVATPRANLFSYDATQQVAPMNDTQRLLLGFQPSGESDDVQVFGTPFTRPGPRQSAMDADAIASDTEDKDHNDQLDQDDEDSREDHEDEDNREEDDHGIIEETPFKTPVRKRRAVSQEFETPAPSLRPHPLRNAISTVSSEFKSPSQAFGQTFTHFGTHLGTQHTTHFSTQHLTQQGFNAGNAAARTSSVVSATPDQVCLLVPWGSTWYPAMAVQPNQYQLLKDDPEAEMDVIFGTAEQGKIKPSQARLLEFQAGDKVNYKGNARYVIVDLQTSPEGSDIATVSGFDRAQLRRIKRKSNIKQETIVVPVKDLVLMAPLFAEWQQTHPADPSTGPPAIHRTQSIDTSTGRPPSRPLGRPTSRSEKRFRKDPGIFEGCVFAVTMANHSCSQQVTAAIAKLGGRILNAGITDLLAVSTDPMELRWGDKSRGDRFAAVIASRPIKTPKYLEGLAVGWPCLSYKFILECASQNLFLDNWTDYVLAAGDSQVMDAAISLDVSDFRDRFDAGQTLAQQFAQRRLALGPIAGPIYLLDSEKSMPLRLLLMAATARPPILISKLNQAPKGSIVIDTDRGAELPVVSEPGMVLRMSRQLVLPQTLVYGREWLIQCIINQRPV